MKLSEFELDVMQVFWEQGELSSPEACKIIAPVKNVTSNTVKTIIHRLEDKGALKRIGQDGRALIFKPSVSQESITTSLLPTFVNRFFGGNAQKLIARLIQEEKMSEDEVQQIQALLDKHKEKGKN